MCQVLCQHLVSLCPQYLPISPKEWLGTEAQPCEATGLGCLVGSMQAHTEEATVWGLVLGRGGQATRELWVRQGLKRSEPSTSTHGVCSPGSVRTNAPVTLRSGRGSQKVEPWLLGGRKVPRTSHGLPESLWEAPCSQDYDGAKGRCLTDWVTRVPLPTDF